MEYAGIATRMRIGVEQPSSTTTKGAEGRHDGAPIVSSILVQARPSSQTDTYLGGKKGEAPSSPE
jgi:hypothetical protein